MEQPECHQSTACAMPANASDVRECHDGASHWKQVNYPVYRKGEEPPDDALRGVLVGLGDSGIECVHACRRRGLIQGVALPNAQTLSEAGMSPDFVLVVGTITALQAAERSFCDIADSLLIAYAIDAINSDELLLELTEHTCFDNIVALDFDTPPTPGEAQWDSIYMCVRATLEPIITVGPPQLVCVDFADIRYVFSPKPFSEALHVRAIGQNHATQACRNLSDTLARDISAKHGIDSGLAVVFTSNASLEPLQQVYQLLEPYAPDAMVTVIEDIELNAHRATDIVLIYSDGRSLG